MKIIAGIISILSLTLSGIVTAVLVFTTPVQAETMGDQELLTRARAEEILLMDNTTIKGMEVAQRELITSYNDVSAAGDGLSTIYEQLPVYQALTLKYETTMANEDYAAYFSLLQRGVGVGYENDLSAYSTTLSEADPEGNSDLITDVNTRITYETVFDEADYGAMISPQEFSQYLVLQDMFARYGIKDANPDDELIYDTFIYTMEIAPLSLQYALEGLVLNTEVVETSLVLGMNSLYNNILSMQETAKLLDSNRTMAQNKALESEAKLSIGLATSSENRKAQIEAEIASLEYEGILRQIDNMTMSLQEMIGMSPVEPLILDEAIEEPGSLESLPYYLDKALEERREVLVAEANVMIKETEIEVMGEWFDTDDDRMEATFDDLADLERDLGQVKKDIEEDIIKAYNNVIAADLSVVDAKNSLAIAEKQYDEMVLRAEMGYVLVGDLTAMEISLINAENDLTSARITYTTARRSLEKASGIGPGFQ